MEQLNIFDLEKEQFKITKPVRLIELFGGIGSQAKALERLGVDFEHYKLIEYNKYPVASYNAVHNTNFVPQDITKVHAKDLEIIDRDKYTYIMTYSFPCQDISVAGLQKGFSKGLGTRSGLLWEVERILNECEELPQVLLMENVPQIISAKNKPDFEEWVRFLESKGYSNYYQILNAKDYGIPQNRKRCFMISLLGNYTYSFPEGEPLKLRLKDILEPEVDEKFYLSEKMVKYISKPGTEGYRNPDCKINLDVARPITTDPNKRAGTTNYISSELPDNYDLIQVAQLYGTEREPNPQAGRVYDSKGLSPTLDTCQGGNRMPKILEPRICSSRSRDDTNPTFRGKTNENFSQHLELGPEGVSNCLSTVQKDNYILEPKKESNEGDSVNSDYLTNFRIRRLTPKECWRLMGFSDEDFSKAEKVNSNAQLYKQAGNSIVVNVLMAIFKQLF